MGVNRIVGVDLHVSQAQGFVSPRTVVDNLEGGFAGLNYFLKNVENKNDIVIVSPDAGGMHRAKTFHGHFEYFGYGAD
jgi:ribose-phosphate pyrophosphokinase